MKKLNFIVVAVFLAAFFSYQAVFGAFYPINRGMVNTSFEVTKTASTTTLLQASAQVGFFSGASAQTVKLPDATTLPDDWWYELINTSSGAITLRDNGNNAIGTIDANRQSKLTLTNNTTTNGTWRQSQTSIVGSGSVIDYSSFSATAPLVYNGAGVYSIPQASAVTDGYLSAADYAMFAAAITPGSSSWLLNGNAGTTPGTDFIGTTDGQSLVFKTNNTEALRLNTSQQIDTGLGAGIIKSTAQGILFNASTIDVATEAVGTLAIGNGGTGQTTQTAAFDALAPGTTRGDLIVYDGSDNVRFPRCLDSEVLTGAASQSSGWVCVNRLSFATNDHGGLNGLTDDDHAQYALLAGRSGGQVLTGGTGAGDDLTLRSTTNGSKGNVILDETTASTSSTTGAMVISGGVGVAGAINLGGIVKTQTALELEDPSAGTGVVHVSAATGTAGYILRFPLEAPTSGQTLQATGTTGALSWATVSGGSGVTYIGSAIWAPNGSCDWPNVQNAAFADVPTDASCNNPTVFGGVTDPGNKQPQVRFNATSGKTYKFEAYGVFHQVSTLGCSWRFHDGTNGSSPQTQYFGSAGLRVPVIIGRIVASSTAATTVTIQSTATFGNGECDIDATTATVTGLEILVFQLD